MSSSFTFGDGSSRLLFPKKHRYSTLGPVPAATAKEKSVLSSAFEKVMLNSRGNHRFSQSISLFNPLKSSRKASIENARLIDSPASDEEKSMSISESATNRQPAHFTSPRLHQLGRGVDIPQRQLMKPLNAFPLPRSQTLNFLGPESDQIAVMPPFKEPLGTATDQNSRCGQTARETDLEETTRFHPKRARPTDDEVKHSTPTSPRAARYCFNDFKNETSRSGFAKRQSLPNRRANLPVSNAELGRSISKPTPRPSSKINRQPIKCSLRHRESCIPTPETRKRSTELTNKTSAVARASRRKTMGTFSAAETLNNDSEDQPRRFLGIAVTPSNGRRSRIPTPIRPARRSNSFMVFESDTQPLLEDFSPNIEHIRPHGARALHQPQTPNTVSSRFGSNNSSPFTSTVRATRTAQPYLMTPTPSVENEYDYSIFTPGLQWAENDTYNDSETDLEDEVENHIRIENQITIAQPTMWWLGRFNSISDRLRTNELLEKAAQATTAGAGDLGVDKDLAAVDHPSNTGMFDDAARTACVFAELVRLCATVEARDSLDEFRIAYRKRMQADNMKANLKALAGAKKVEAETALKMQRQQQLQRRLVGLNTGNDDIGEVKGKVNVFERLGMRRKSKA